MKSFKETEFVIFDVETTGLSPSKGDRMIEIAGLKVKDLKPGNSFCSLINPHRDVSPGAFKVNGITSDMLKDAPTAEEVLPAFIDFIGDSCLVGHNVKFDIGFLSNELSLMGEEVNQDIVYLDTVRMARALIPDAGRFSLISLVHAFDIDKKQKHRAMSDVMITYEVFCRLLEIADRKDVYDIDILINLFGSFSVDNKRKEAKVAIIREAIEEGQLLDLVYAGKHFFEITMRIVSPKRLRGSGKNTILEGFCHMRDAERKFDIGKIVDIKKI